MTGGVRVDNGGKVPGKIIGIAASVIRGESKGDLQPDLAHPDEFSVSPGLTVNRDVAPVGSNRIQERLAIAGKSRTAVYFVGKQPDALSIRDRDLVDSSLLSR